jgi:RHS repeat-associated protein
VPSNRRSRSGSGKTAVTYSYDAAGNVTNDGLHSYSYDAENRLVALDATAAQYAYDHQNRRVKKTTGGGTVQYVWQGAQAIAEYNGTSGALLSEYVYSGGRLLAKVESGATSYFLSDRLSVRLLLDGSGNVVGRQAHLPFGEDFAESGAQQKQHFTSYERESESGLDYAINRYYESYVGRFLQADPYRPSSYMEDPRSWNRYSYTRNVLTNRVDPLGLEDDPSQIICANCVVNISPSDDKINPTTAALGGTIGNKKIIPPKVDGNTPGPGESPNTPECSPAVRAKMDSAWRASTNGLPSGTEFGFVVYQSPNGALGATDPEGSHSHDEAQIHTTLPPGYKLVAIFHTHPTDRDPHPSEGDRAAADSSHVPFYTITRDGLFMYDPNNPPKKDNYKPIRSNLDWLKPCK